RASCLMSAQQLIDAAPQFVTAPTGFIQNRGPLVGRMLESVEKNGSGLLFDDGHSTLAGRLACSGPAPLLIVRRRLADFLTKSENPASQASFRNSLDSHARP